MFGDIQPMFIEEIFVPSKKFILFVKELAVMKPLDSSVKCSVKRYLDNDEDKYNTFKRQFQNGERQARHAAK